VVVVGRERSRPTLPAQAEMVGLAHFVS
jgi:hypothetical protein